MSEPVGKCKVVSVEPRRDHAHAVYARVWVEDAAGGRWYFDAACLNFELRSQSETGAEHG